jgi:hypothetical protein
MNLSATRSLRPVFTVMMTLALLVLGVLGSSGWAPICSLTCPSWWSW